MSKRRNVLITSLFILPLILFHFQNCGRTGAVAHAGSQDLNGGVVKIVDDFNKAEIEFAQPSVEIQDDAQSVEVGGPCNRSHNGSRLRWAVWATEQSDAPLLSGEGSCEAGQFGLQLEDLENLVCGTSHLIVVEGDWGGSTFAHITRRCQPLTSQKVAAPESSPLGTSCAMEYSPASAASDPCVQVCYRDAKLVSSTPLEPSQCASLAAGLTGP